MNNFLSTHLYFEDRKIVLRCMYTKMFLYMSNLQNNSNVVTTQVSKNELKYYEAYHTLRSSLNICGQ